MISPSSSTDLSPRDSSGDVALASQIVAGNATAIETFYRDYRPLILRTLQAKADSQCARHGVPEVLDEVMAECVAATKTSKRYGGEAYCLLERYLRPARSSEPPGPLLPWLRRVAIHRLIDWVKIHCVYYPEPGGPAREERGGDGGTEPTVCDSDVTPLIVDALRHGFRSAIDRAPVGVLALLLTMVHGVQGKHLARALGVHPANISVPKLKALELIQSETLAYLRHKEPLLEISWEDMMAVMAAEKNLIVSLLT